MKKLSMFFLVAVAGTTTAVAQKATSMPVKEVKHVQTKMNDDGVMMDNGKMMVMKGGKTSAMDKDLTLTNGSVVMPNGMIKMQDGTSKQLKNGDCVYMDGKIVPLLKPGTMHRRP